jgi:hypothetical protein
LPLAPRAEVPRASTSNALVCQTSITASIGAKGLSAPLSNHSPLKILLELADRRGRSRASLPDGTVIVGSSRQPFLGAARVLMAMGYSPDRWLEGWGPVATAFALRARLGIAAGLTVDETRTVFAPWKPFSLSAVSSSIRHSEEAASTLAPAPSALLLAPASTAITKTGGDRAGRCSTSPHRLQSRPASTTAHLRPSPNVPPTAALGVASSTHERGTGPAQRSKPVGGNRRVWNQGREFWKGSKMPSWRSHGKSRIRCLQSTGRHHGRLLQPTS